MILNIEHQANWEYNRQRKQDIINKNNDNENKKQIPHEYTIGDHILSKKGTENKYEQPYSGPHPILEVHDNGTVTIQKGAVSEQVNIRRITPYISPQVFDQGGGCNMRSKRAKRHNN